MPSLPLGLSAVRCFFVVMPGLFMDSFMAGSCWPETGEMSLDGTGFLLNNPANAAIFVQLIERMKKNPAQIARRLKKRTDACLEEMVEILSRTLGERDMANPFGPLWLFRSTKPTEPLHAVYRPSLCFVAQGGKVVLLGKTRHVYDPRHFLLASVDLPVIGQVLKASASKPYLGVRIDLDPVSVGSVLVEMSPRLPVPSGNAKAIAVSEVKPPLLEAALRLLRLVDAPEDIPVIAPLVIREIIYRLLACDQGARLQHVALLGGQAHRVARIAERLRAELGRPLRIPALARDLGISVSGLHHQFKAVTSMSPVQFLRLLRLQEARRLMLADGLDAGEAGLRVGYDDASHFNREYRRLFGHPPKRDITRLTS
jgi:AraC-like DNA-binding protein